MNAVASPGNLIEAARGEARQLPQINPAAAAENALCDAFVLGGQHGTVITIRVRGRIETLAGVAAGACGR
jgi:hypothetical protein